MRQKEDVLHVTESVCPVCLKKIEARHVLSEGDVYLRKTCAEHGDFSVIIWRGVGKPDYGTWIKEKAEFHPVVCQTERTKGCPYDCGLCPEHRQQTCCVVLEVTGRCNLNCNFCFAGSKEESVDPPLEKIREWLEYLARLGRPFIHLSGGEPTVRDDLPEIVRLAKEMGFPYIQLNTNGLRLAAEPAYVKTLKNAGVSSVFMQFDGTEDEIYRRLRGRNLLQEKEKAIENCGQNHLGVVLVPTVVPGVNSDNIGGIIRFATERIPLVRGIHFQPVSYLGRYPEIPQDAQRITLPEIISAIESQTDGVFKTEYFKPSGCDHARCGFHSDFVQYPDGTVQPLKKAGEQPACCCSKPADAGKVEKNRKFVAQRWVRNDGENAREEKNITNDSMEDIDYFISRVRSHGFTITGMAFQDCWNIDLQRLQECSLHVFSPDGRLIPFCSYNLSNVQGEPLYGRREQLSLTKMPEDLKGLKNEPGCCCCANR